MSAFTYKNKSKSEMDNLLDRIGEAGYCFSSEYYPRNEEDFCKWSVLRFDINSSDDFIGCQRDLLNGDIECTLEEFEHHLGLTPKPKHYGSKLVFNFLS